MINSLKEDKIADLLTGTEPKQATTQPASNASASKPQRNSEELKKEIGYLRTHTLEGGLVPQ